MASRTQKTSTPAPQAPARAPARKAARKTVGKAVRKAAGKSVSPKAPATSLKRTVAKKAAPRRAVNGAAVVEPAAKTLTDAKPVKPTKAVKKAEAPKQAKQVKPAKADKPGKAAKVIRDSFTMPQSDFAIIDRIKLRAIEWKQPVKKSEVLRAALHALEALGDAKVRALLAALEPIKKGRPRSS